MWACTLLIITSDWCGFPCWSQQNINIYKLQHRGTIIITKNLTCFWFDKLYFHNVLFKQTFMKSCWRLHLKMLLLVVNNWNMEILSLLFWSGCVFHWLCCVQNWARFYLWLVTCISTHSPIFFNAWNQDLTVFIYPELTLYSWYDIKIQKLI